MSADRPGHGGHGSPLQFFRPPHCPSAVRPAARRDKPEQFDLFSEFPDAGGKMGDEMNVVAKLAEDVAEAGQTLLSEAACKRA